MSQMYKAYAAVHDTEARDNLSSNRDAISEMVLTKMKSSDLQDVAEEVITHLLFHMRLDVPTAEGLVECTLAEAAAEGFQSEGRTEKITRLEEAFVAAFDRVTENAPLDAVEGFNEYLFRKNINEKREDSLSVDRSQKKVHNKIIAEDRAVVKDGLIQMIEATYGETPGQELAKKEKDDDAFGAPKKKARYKVTKADERGGTEAWKRYKAGHPSYTKEQIELINSLVESGKFTDEEIGTILEKEVKVKDTYKTVAAIVDYDRSKKGSKDATYDSDHGKKKQAKKERDYAAWEREKMKRDDPNWKSKKYHTGMHGESVEADEYIETVAKVKKAELEADKERWGEEFKSLTPDKKQQIKNQAERRSKSANRAQMASDYKTSTKQDQQVRNMKRVSD